jgi:hypothetical protein
MKKNYAQVKERTMHYFATNFTISTNLKNVMQSATLVPSDYKRMIVLKMRQHHAKFL